MSREKNWRGSHIIQGVDIEKQMVVGFKPEMRLVNALSNCVGGAETFQMLSCKATYGDHTTLHVLPERCEGYLFADVCVVCANKGFLFLKY
jgi:hypothetical protein